MKKLYMCIHFMHSLGLVCPGSGMAERHQILYPGFSKPGYHHHRSAVSDHRKLHQSDKQQASGSKQNNGYDFHLVKLNQQGEEVWEKYFSGQNHDYLSATVTTQDGGFLLAGTSYSGKGLDKKRIPKADQISG
jgi:hypothetical protein